DHGAGQWLQCLGIDHGAGDIGACGHGRQQRCQQGRGRYRQQGRDAARRQQGCAGPVATGKTSHPCAPGLRPASRRVRSRCCVGVALPHSGRASKPSRNSCSNGSWMVHWNCCWAEAVPSLAVVVTWNTPAVSGSPVTSPVLGERTRPPGRPLAEYSSTSPSGSLKKGASGNDTAVPTAPVLEPTLPTVTGARLMLSTVHWKPWVANAPSGSVAVMVTACTPSLAKPRLPYTSPELPWIDSPGGNPAAE